MILSVSGRFRRSVALIGAVAVAVVVGGGVTGGVVLIEGDYVDDDCDV